MAAAAVVVAAATAATTTTMISAERARSATMAAANALTQIRPPA